MRAAGFVLVGGQSSRMGQNKARLKVDSRLLVEVIAAKLQEVTGRVTLIGNPAAFGDLPFDCFPDLRPGLGPLGGLETALSSSHADFNVIVGCDMPGIPAAALAHLLAVSQQSGALCTMALDSEKRRHPLCAVYRVACLPFVRDALDAGRLRLLDLVEELRAAEVAIDLVLENLNTPEEFAEWRAAHLAVAD
jgi:molybdopterin-guanine dinucleotide biosynthesis protein A